MKLMTSFGTVLVFCGAIVTELSRVELGLEGVFVLTAQPRSDARGTFVRHFALEDIPEFSGVERVTHANLVWTSLESTFRGMHYQVAPYAETKLLSCLTGGISSVLTDLRVESATYRSWTIVNLTENEAQLLLIPQGVANGYLTRSDDVLVHYYSTEKYSPLHERGFRFDDPAIGLVLPERPVHVSKKDESWPAIDHLDNFPGSF
jgi:dTDP-4-dehydrorhamnose 3,5-epimerase